MQIKKSSLGGVHANLPELPQAMELEADGQEDVHFGYRHDLSALREKAIAYHAIEKKSRPFKLPDATGYAFRGFI